MDHEQLRIRCIALAHGDLVEAEKFFTFAKDEDVKLDCLNMANGDLGEAKRFFDFIKGRNQNDLVGGGKARVVGKDGNVPDALKDYKPE